MNLHRAPLLALLLAGCVINGDKYPRPRDLEQPWKVTKPRLLAVASEPAEPRPGESVVFSALLPDPTGEIESTLWLACISPDEGGTGFGCVDGQDPDLIGVQPGLDPAYTTPVDLLDGLEERERREGRYVLVQVTGLPEFDLTDPEIDFEAIDFNQVEAGYKRVVVSEATTPNHNPGLLGFTVDREDVPPGAVLVVDPGEPYEIGAVYDDGTVERYEYLNRDGEPELRDEEPYVSWYATDGEVREPVTLHPFLVATWIAPEQSGVEGSIWAVARDRRGGMAWQELAFRVR